MAQPARGAAIRKEMPTSRVNSADSRPRIPLVEAARTLRIPISFVRRSAMNAASPKMPMQPMRRAREAKARAIFPTCSSDLYISLNARCRTWPQDVHDEGADVLVHRFEVEILYDTDDLVRDHPVVVVVRPIDIFCEGITGTQDLCRRLVDDHGGRVAGIGGGEIAPADQRHPHRPEIIIIDAPELADEGGLCVF